jgi:hypothetical protein
VILLFILALYLFFGGISHIILPEKNSVGHSVSDVAKGLYVSVLFIFGGVVILSVFATKRLR